MSLGEREDTDKIPGRQAKHAKLYSDSLHDLKIGPLTAMGFSAKGNFNFCVRSALLQHVSKTGHEKVYQCQNGGYRLSQRGDMRKYISVKMEGTA